mgnify:CR=1 FL=1
MLFLIFVCIVFDYKTSRVAEKDRNRIKVLFEFVSSERSYLANIELALKVRLSIRSPPGGRAGFGAGSPWCFNCHRINFAFVPSGFHVKFINIDLFLSVAATHLWFSFSYLASCFLYSFFF